MIIYGVLTNTSIPQLYIAAIIPGIILAVLFSLTIAAQSMWSGAREQRVAATWHERWHSLRYLIPPLLIFFVIMGSIYGGIATPTESAGLGVLAALALVLVRRRLGWTMLLAAFENTMRTTAMIMLIVVFAYFLNFVLAGAGLSRAINSMLGDLGLGPTETILLIIVFYLVLGCFMETLSMMIATLPIVAPIVFAAGFDPIWFGVVMMILIEMAMITPPIGINLYVVQGVRTSGSIRDVMIGASPFVITMLLMLILLLIWPEISLFLVNG
jgi:tripartite ATP-independent transporter DctM subunit